jgi:hypothetical protein
VGKIVDSGKEYLLGLTDYFTSTYRYLKKRQGERHVSALSLPSIILDGC